MNGFQIKAPDLFDRSEMVSVGSARRAGANLEIEDKQGRNWTMTFGEDMVQLTSDGRTQTPSYQIQFRGNQIAVKTSTPGMVSRVEEESIELGSPIQRSEQERLALDVGGSLLGMPLGLLLRA